MTFPGSGDNLFMTRVDEDGDFLLENRVTTKFMKYLGKNQAFFYNGYDWGVDMKTDSFLDSLTWKEKKEFKEKTDKIWDNLQYDNDTSWYLILEGKDEHGKSKVALYQDEDEFKKVRDAEYDPTTPNCFSSKACWFFDLTAAKQYIQMCRDEEGIHWDWPDTIPVIYTHKGPLTMRDVGNFPGWTGRSLTLTPTVQVGVQGP